MFKWLYKKLLMATSGNSTGDPEWDQVVLSMHGDTAGVEGTYEIYWNNVILAMHMDGADNGTTFTDLKGNTISRFGDTKTVTAVKKFGTASAYFDGNGDYLHTATLPAIGTGDFTLECWIYMADATPSTLKVIFDNRHAGSELHNGIIVWVDTAGKLFVGYTASGFTGTTIMQDNTWHHIAVTRASGVFRSFVDGVLQGSQTPSSKNLSHNNALIGTPFDAAGSSSLSFVGYIDDFRITNGVARYTDTFTPPTTAFQDNAPVFTDVKGKVITTTGNTLMSVSTRKFGIGSMYFDGAGDYLTLPGGQDFAFGTGDFTVEGWINPTSVASTPYLIDFRSAAGTVAGSLYLSGGALIYAHSNTARITGATVLSTATWYHFAVCRSNGVTRLFLNGALQGSAYTDTTNYVIGTNRPIIGADQAGANGLNGYIDDLRVTKGVARYTADFSNSLDPYWGNTVLAMHGDDLQNGGGSSNDPYYANTIVNSPFDYGYTDYASTPVTWTNLTNVSINTSVKKFGTGSISIGASGTTGFTSSGNLTLVGDCTIEFWIYPNAGTASSRNVFLAGLFQFSVSTSGGGTYYFAGGVAKGHSITAAANAWTHIAIVRQGTTSRIYANGVQATTDTVSSSNIVGQVFCARYNGADTTLNGYLDDFRITNGVCRYPNGTTFTPPTDANPSPAAVFTDLKGKTVTPVGNATTSNSIKKYGTASIYFDGAGDYLAVPNSSDFDFPADFTIEAWVYITANATYHGILEGRGQATATSYACGIYYSGGVLRPDFYIAGAANRTGTSTVVSLNTWTHVAFVRSGSTVSLYVDGVKDSVVITYAGTVDALSGTDVWIGALRDPLYFNGYIDDLRITKGVARYTGTFTPPGAAFPDPNFPHTTFLKANPDFGRPVDPYWNNVVLAMHMDGLDNGTVFHDEKGKTVTVVGNTKTVVATKKFGNSSAYFDGSGDYLTLADSADWDLRTGDFTIECWVYLTGSRLHPIVQRRNFTTGNGWFFLVDVDNSLNITGFSGTPQSYLASAAGAVPLNAWTHISATYSGGTTRLFVNGIEVASNATISYGSNPAQVLEIGHYSNGAPQFYTLGYIDDLRITKGIARYTSNFSVPTRAFPRS